jgi:hypothetical protein
MDKLNELSTGEKLIAGGGVVMLIASFLPWYHVSVSVGGFSASASANGWDNPGSLFSILAVIIGVVMAGAVLGPKLGNMQLPDLGSITWPQAFMGGGVAALVLVVIKFLNESSSISYGFFLGFLAAIALAAGGYMMYTEEKGTQPFWSSRR